MNEDHEPGLTITEWTGWQSTLYLNGWSDSSRIGQRNDQWFVHLWPDNDPEFNGVGAYRRTSSELAAVIADVAGVELWVAADVVSCSL
jgi:hypothetical protein